MIDLTTGESLDLDGSLAGTSGHAFAEHSWVEWRTGRGFSGHMDRLDFERPAGLPIAKPNLFAGRCGGCKGAVEAGTGFYFTGEDGLRCRPCAVAIDARLEEKQKRHVLPTLAVREALDRRAENKRRRGGGRSMAKILAREAELSPEEAKVILGQLDKEPEDRKGRRAAEGRNVPCPCGSAKKLKSCCEGSKVARARAKRLVAHAAYVAQLNRVGKKQLATHVWKCRRRFLCATCKTPGCSKHGKAEALAPIFYCGDRLCPLCAHQKARRHVERVKRVLKTMAVDPRHLSHLTLTVKNLPRFTAQVWPYMRAVWWRFQALIAMKYPCRSCKGTGRRPSGASTDAAWASAMAADEGIDDDAEGARAPRHPDECRVCCGSRSVIRGAFRAIEATASEEGVHPHIHALIVHEEKIDQRDVAAALMIASEGAGFDAHIRRVTKSGDQREAEEALEEIAKYDTKVLEVPDEHLVDLHDSLRGQHLKDCSGLMHGVPDDEEPEGDAAEHEASPCSDCGGVRRLEGVWLTGRRRYQALAKNDSVWPGWLRPEMQSSIPGLREPPWRPPDEEAPP